MLKVYIANPLIFSPATRGWYKDTMIPAVEKYVKVINAPGDSDNGDAKVMTNEERSKYIFDLNVELLDEADFVICVIDGVQTDDGTAWEVGYAWANGKPSIGVRFDMRQGCREQISKHTNLMLENSFVDFALGLDNLEKALEKFVAERE